jgi:hypothetical protein
MMAWGSQGGHFWGQRTGHILLPPGLRLNPIGQVTRYRPWYCIYMFCFTSIAPSARLSGETSRATMSSHSHSSRSDESLSSGIHQQHVSGHGISEQPDPFQTPPLSESPLSPSSSTPSISSPAEAVPTGTSSPSIPQSPPRRLRFSELSLSEAVLQGGPTRRGHSRRTLSSHSTVSLRKPYPSTKLRGEHPKPWLKYPDPAQRWARVIFWTLFAVGFAASGASESRPARPRNPVPFLLSDQYVTSVMPQSLNWAKCKPQGDGQIAASN